MRFPAEEGGRASAQRPAAQAPPWRRTVTTATPSPRPSWGSPGSGSLVEKGERLLQSPCPTAKAPNLPRQPGPALPLSLPAGRSPHSERPPPSLPLSLLPTAAGRLAAGASSPPSRPPPSLRAHPRRLPSPNVRRDDEYAEERWPRRGSGRGMGCLCVCVSVCAVSVPRSVCVCVYSAGRGAHAPCVAGLNVSQVFETGIWVFHVGSSAVYRSEECCVNIAGEQRRRRR